MSTGRSVFEEKYEAIDAHFQRVIAPELEALEARREKDYKKSKLILRLLLYIVLPLSILAIWVFVGTADIPRSIFYSFFILIFGGVGSKIIASLFTLGVIKEAKHITLNGLTDYLGWRYTPKPERPAIIEQMKAMPLIVSLGSELYEDQISGQALGHNFSLAEARLEASTEVNDRPIFIFSGLILSVDFPRAFDGFTFVRRKETNQSWRKPKTLKSIGFSASEFKAKFDVFGSDQVEAHYLLAPDIVEIFLDIETILGGELVAAVYSADQLHLMLRAENRYEITKADRRFSDPEIVERMKLDMSAVYQLVQGLDKSLVR